MKENKAIELCVLYFPYLDQMDTEQSKSFHITNNKIFFKIAEKRQQINSKTQEKYYKGYAFMDKKVDK